MKDNIKNMLKKIDFLLGYSTYILGGAVIACYFVARFTDVAEISPRLLMFPFGGGLFWWEAD